MAAPETSALVLLAAGRSRRFGDTDKLLVPYLGRPIGVHAAVAFETVPFKARVAVVSCTDLPIGGFGYEVVVNDAPEAGLSRSLRLGVERAMATDIEAIVIALADMPRVTAAQLWRLFDAAHGPEAVVASSDGTAPRPPALFGTAHFETLLDAQGDKGMRDLIRAGHHVVTSPAELIDVDTPADFEKLMPRTA